MVCSKADASVRAVVASDALDTAKAAAAAESKDEIAKYTRLQKRSLQDARSGNAAGTDGAEHGHAILQMLHKANGTCTVRLGRPNPRLADPSRMVSSRELTHAFARAATIHPSMV